MKISLILKNGYDLFNLSPSVTSIQLNTDLYDTAGKMEVELIDSGTNIINNGNLIFLVVDDINIFLGYIFVYSKNEGGKIKLTAYDQLRYLKNQDTIYYEDKTASQILEDICVRNNLKCNIVHPSNWKVLPYLFDASTMFEIIKHALDETFEMEQEKYIIRDNFGQIEFLKLSELKTNLQVGNNSVLTSYDYELSIDDDTYNVVKIVRDNPTTQKRDVWLTQDSETINKWGRLQYLYTADENANEEQIKELSENILKLKNKETRSIDIKILGFYNLKAGDGVKLVIDGIIDEWLYLESVKTSIAGENTTIDLTLTLL